MAESLSQVLGRFACRLSYESLPEEVSSKTKALILHGIGVGVAGFELEPARMAREVVKAEEKASSSNARLLVDGTRVSVMGAAFANAVLFHSRVQEDTHGTTHIGTVVIPVALALAEREGRSGKDLLAAVTAGYEVAAALGKDHTALSTPRGFRASPVYGIFGAGVAAGKLLRLNPTQMAHALGLAASCAFGTTEAFRAGTMEWRFQNGVAARSGILAALLARQGVVAAETALEGKSGFFQAFAGTTEGASGIGDALGRDWEVFRVDFKVFPVCAFNQTPCAAALALARETQIPLGEVAQIRVKLNPYEAHYPGMAHKGPFRSIDQTLMSTPFCVATALVNQEVTVAGLREFDSPPVLTLVDKTTLEADESKGPSCAEIEIRTEDGRKWTRSMNISPGHYRLSLEEDADLIRRLAPEMVLRRDQVEEMIQLVKRLEALEEVSPLIDSTLLQRPP